MNVIPPGLDFSNLKVDCGADAWAQLLGSAFGSVQPGAAADAPQGSPDSLGPETSRKSTSASRRTSDAAQGADGAAGNHSAPPLKSDAESPFERFARLPEVHAALGVAESSAAAPTSSSPASLTAPTANLPASPLTATKTSKLPQDTAGMAPGKGRHTAVGFIMSKSPNLVLESVQKSFKRTLALF